MKSVNRFFSLFFLTLTAFIFNSNGYAQTILVNPDTLYMGQIPVSSTNVRQTKVINLSSSTLEISDFSISNDAGSNFKILNDPGSVSLGLLQSYTLQIEYAPSTNDSNVVELVIISNASTSPDRMQMSGKGLTNSPPTFERIFGDEENNKMNSVQQTSDGGYILGGSTVLPKEDFTDMYIVKTDALGKIEWETVVGDDETEDVSKILQTSDGGYLAFGKTDSEGGGKFDFYLVKLNAAGDVVWDKTYGGNRDEKSADMIETSDGNYFLLGNTLSFGDGLNSDVYLIKINGEGTELWSTRYGGPSGDSGDKIVATQDGNYSILASTASFGAGGFDIWLIKIDGVGGELWNKTFGGSEDEEGNGLTELPDASLVMVGFTRTFGAGAKDVYIIKTDASGNEIWNQVNGSNFQDVATNVVSEVDGIIYTATFSTTSERSTELIIKIDFNGNEVWESQINGGASDLALNSEQHLIVAGSTGRYGNDSEVYFLNVNQLGDITDMDDQPTETPVNFNLNNNYPNPFNNQTNISFQLFQAEHVELSIYNIMGQKIMTLISDKYSAGTHSIGFNSDGLASGVYFYQLKTNTGMMVKQMMLLK